MADGVEAVWEDGCGEAEDCVYVIEVECVLRVEDINRFGVSVVCFVKRRQRERRVGFLFLR